MATATVQVRSLPAEAHIAGLRSRLVSRLTSLSTHQLRYWHESGLLEASLRSGQRGVPRLYSWVDYLRLRIASNLREGGVPTPRIRRALSVLDRTFPDWYLLPIQAHDGHVLTEASSLSSPLLADIRQHVLAWTEDLADVGEKAAEALREMSEGGPLGELSRFDQHVVMDPRINLGQPTVRGTGLETSFVANLARDLGPHEVATLYRLSDADVESAVGFEEAVA